MNLRSRARTHDVWLICAGVLLAGCTKQRIDLAPTPAAHAPPAAAAGQPAAASQLGGGGYGGNPAPTGTGGSRALGSGGMDVIDTGPAAVFHPMKIDADAIPDVTSPHLPVATRACPQLVGEGNYTFNNIPLHVFIAPNAVSKPAPGGPFVVFWHDVGGSWQEASTALGPGSIEEITSRGGVVAVPLATNNCSGCITTGSDVWFVQDFATIDEVLACAIQQAKIDTRHIHAVGMGVGGLQASAQMLNRASYIASVISYSGGESPIAGTQATDDTTNRGAYLLTYGDSMSDVSMISFKTQSEALFDHQTIRGAFVMMCATGAGHAIDANTAPHALRFLFDHGYKVVPSPYERTIPSEFPSYCTNHK